jgi:predicted O-methyltransferase YrrM
MMALWANVRAYLRYRRKAVTKYSVHSPFVFDLVTRTLPAGSQDNTIFSAEKWREECLSNQMSIDVKDFGTGKSGSRTIASIAKRAAKTPKEGRLLYRIVKRFQPKTILELGTSLGISAHYLHAGARDAKLLTIEGCAETARIAGEGFKRHNITVQQRVGDFQSVLPGVLNELKTVDLVYIDGNHRKEATLDYFRQIRKYAHNETVFIFDDIHWSVEMEEAWAAICADPEVHVSIDVFHFGLVFFRKEQVKEHFVLRW